MERYRVTAGHDVGVRQRPAFYSNDAVPFPPKPLISREPGGFTAQLRPRASGDNHGRLRRLGEDSELSIFEAERYFNEANEEDSVGPEEGRSQKKDSAFGRADASPDPRDSCSLSSVDGGGRSRHGGSHYATPTASSEASWNSRSGLLTNPPGSLSVSVRAFPSDEQRKGNSSASACRWLLGRSCPCSGKKAVEVQEKYSVPMSPSHSNFDSIASVSLKKKDSGAGDTFADQYAAALKELEMGSEWEMPKLKLVAGNWINEQDHFRDSSDHSSPGKHFPPEVASHRIVRAGKPFKDGGVTAFSFPVLVQPITATGKPANNASTPPDDPRRDSLEVFRPAEEAKLPRNSADLQRRAVTTQMQMFPPRLDGAPRRSFTFPASPSGRVAAVEDDLASDSSSDLFEIESLSTQATSSAGYRRRDSLDEPRRPAGGASIFPRLRRTSDERPAPSVAPSECYPPSEASVQWSVATAEGGFGPGSVANFSSAASDCDNVGFTQPDHHAFSVAVAGGGGKRRGGGLLSCRCEKAVSVGPSPVRFGNERRPQFPSEEGSVKATARVRNGSSTVAHLLTRPAGASVAGR